MRESVSSLDYKIIVPKPTIQRLPAYLQLLKRFQAEGVENISCNIVAEELNLNPVLVRKDLASVSSVGGRPKIGYRLDTLILDVEHYLGYRDIFPAILVGTGHLGSALLAYPGFPDYGVEIVAAFDINVVKDTVSATGKSIMNIDHLAEYCLKNDIRLGIITVPATSAQDVCDALIAAGIRAIWNFAPTHLKVPAHILVQNEDMAIPLAMLSKHLQEME